MSTGQVASEAGGPEGCLSALSDGFVEGSRLRGHVRMVVHPIITN